MSEPYWLTREEYLALHDMMLSFYGGVTGVRDQTLLDSALAKARQRYSYATCDLPDLAAAYATGVVKNHPFIDGNKRTGFMMAAGFLERNGLEFHAAEVDVVLRTLALAAGEMDEASYAGWLRANSKQA